MCMRRTRRALDAVLIIVLGDNLNLLVGETGEGEGKAVDHVEWVSKELRVQKGVWAEEPESSPP